MRLHTASLLLCGVLLGAAVGSTADVCDSPPLADNECGFYRDCVEEHYPCGDDGYALGYGLKYCQRFSEYDGCDDDAWNNWVNSTLVCLQRSLVGVVQMDASMLSCRGIKSTAFDSHPLCYTGGGADVPTDPSICFLPVADQVCVLKIIDISDLLHPADIKQELDTARICVKQLTSRGLCDRMGDRDTDLCKYWRDRVTATADRIG
jgi:hypothetical protein